MKNAFIGDTLFTIYDALKIRIEAEFRTLGIGYGQIKILMKLYANTDMPYKQSNLSKNLGIDKSNTSRNILKLKDKDYIEVIHLNKRDKAIILTNKGKELKTQVIRILNMISTVMTKNISESELKITNHVLQIMEENLT